MKQYIHWRIIYFFEGLFNIIRWIPTLYKDKDYDHFYITEMLRKKIEFQRSYLVKKSRHCDTPSKNYWMTIVLNLIEREHADYYAMEKYDYYDEAFEFVPANDIKNTYALESTISPSSDRIDEYLAKYPASVRAVKKRFSDRTFTDLHTLALYVGIHNQKKCRALIFDILKTKSQDWWD